MIISDTRGDIIFSIEVQSLCVTVLALVKMPVTSVLAFQLSPILPDSSNVNDALQGQICLPLRFVGREFGNEVRWQVPVRIRGGDVDRKVRIWRQGWWISLMAGAMDVNLLGVQ